MPDKIIVDYTALTLETDIYRVQVVVSLDLALVWFRVLFREVQCGLDLTKPPIVFFLISEKVKKICYRRRSYLEIYIMHFHTTISRDTL